MTYTAASAKGSLSKVAKEAIRWAQILDECYDIKDRKGYVLATVKAVTGDVEAHTCQCSDGEFKTLLKLTQELGKKFEV